MKNPAFFYQQYDKIDWENQRETGLNQGIYEHIIDDVLAHDGSLSVFDIGFGVGVFLETLSEHYEDKDVALRLAGCEPSTKNYENFDEDKAKHDVHTFNEPFQSHTPQRTYDYITANYVMPEFIDDDLPTVAETIKEGLADDGEFIMTISNDDYLQRKLDNNQDLIIETDTVTLHDEAYEEKLYYAEIPEIGKVIDYFREDKFYEDLFNAHGFELKEKTVLEDTGFVCTLFRFKLDTS